LLQSCFDFAPDQAFWTADSLQLIKFYALDFKCELVLLVCLWLRDFSRSRFLEFEAISTDMKSEFSQWPEKSYEKWYSALFSLEEIAYFDGLAFYD
jgi:hypothetical protein